MLLLAAVLSGACAEGETAPGPASPASPTPSGDAAAEAPAATSAEQPDAVVPPAGPDDASGADLLAQGLALLRRGKPEEAMDRLRAARRQRPDDPQVAFYLARTLHVDTKLGEAEEAYLAAVRLMPSMAEAWLRLSEIYLEQGRLEEALGALDGLAAGRGPGPLVEYQKGFVLSKMARFDEAEQHLRRSLAQRPERADTWYVLGVNAQRGGDPAAAANAFSEALRRDPSYADAWFNLGNALARLGRAEEAEQALARFASVNEARERQRAMDARLRSLRKGAEMDLDAGRLERAVAQVDEAASLAPGLPWIPRVRGELLLTHGRPEEAAALFEQAAALNASEAAEHVALARAFRLVANAPAAAREKQLALELLARGQQ